MGSAILLLSAAALQSRYHQPTRRRFPAMCVVLILACHVLYCALFWSLCIDGATSGSALAQLSFYAFGAPLAAVFSLLAWLVYESAGQLTQPITAALSVCATLVVLLVVTLGVFYAWQLAAGLTLAVITVFACAAAVHIYRRNNGYLPRWWRRALAALAVVLALVGVAIALVAPSNSSLAAVNGFVGGCPHTPWNAIQPPHGPL